MNNTRQYAIIRSDYLPIMTCTPKTDQLMLNIPKQALLLLMAALLMAPVTGCVYRIDVQQGNLLKDNEIEAVKVGMTRSQVRFLLGTPAVADPFQQDRWDYIYYFRQGRKGTTDRSWLIVLFDGERVREIRRDVPVSPT